MNGINNGGILTVALHTKKIQEVIIYRATKKFITLQILQPISIVWKCLRNIEGVDPKGFKFSMFSLVLSRRIPFEY
jgi:hypothetical protein